MCGGAVTVVTTARATSAGCIVLKWRWIPNRCQCGKISVKISVSQSSAKPVERRADAHDRRSDREALAFHRECRSRTTRARPWSTRVGTEVGPGVHRRVGGDEHDVAGRVAGPEIGDDALGHEDRAEEVRREDASCMLVAPSRAVAPGAAVPALLTRTSTGPSAAVVRREERVDRRRRRHTSSGCATAVPPASATSAAVSSSWSTRRAPSATGQPSAPSACAMARPMPADAPVTTATRGDDRRQPSHSPPLTSSVWPVTTRDHGETKNTTAVGDVVLGRDQPERDATFDLAAHDVASTRCAPAASIR